MIRLNRTTSADTDFQNLVTELDKDLRIRDGEDHSFFAQFNKIDNIKHVVVAYQGDIPVGCGAIKQYDETTMEVKRMFVPRNIAGRELRHWCLPSWSNGAGNLAMINVFWKPVRNNLRLFSFTIRTITR